jgi:hypothetical protein
LGDIPVAIGGKGIGEGFGVTHGWSSGDLAKGRGGCKGLYRVNRLG